MQSVRDTMLRGRGLPALLTFLVVACVGGDALAQQAPPAQAGVRQLEITASTPGARVVVDGFGPFVRGQVYGLPTTIALDTSAHNLEVRRVGFETARIPVSAGTQDLRLDVQMSRPVFEAGIALTVIGGIAFLAASGVELGAHLEAQKRGAYIAASGIPAWMWLSWSLGGAGLIAGIVMLVRDRHRNPTWTWGQ
jgi:hypothetical protein